MTNEFDQLFGDSTPTETINYNNMESNLNNADDNLVNENIQNDNFMETMGNDDDIDENIAAKTAILLKILEV